MPVHLQALWGLLEAPSIIVLCALVNYQETGATNMTLIRAFMLFNLLYTLPWFILRQQQRISCADFIVQQQQQRQQRQQRQQQPGRQQHSPQCKVQPSQRHNSGGSRSSGSGSLKQCLATQAPIEQQQSLSHDMPAQDLPAEAPHRQSQSSAQAPAAAPRAACLPGRKKSSVLYRSKVSRSASVSIKAS